MGSRRQAREAAVQILYLRDLNPHEALDDALRRFWEEQTYDSDVQQFGETLARGALEQRAALDEHIRRVAENWELDRIAAVDRNILRLAIYEMMYRDDVPPVVSINEAIEIAKKFSTKESGKFVNGILDRIRKDLPRPARTAKPAADTPSTPSSEPQP
ncbi:MAG: transcription antitermination factor NusB [Verrucomicrobia bacterium]|nr:transcription antitermination factor NusB [Verrucomicrobiota bacterium]